MPRPTATLLLALACLSRAALADAQLPPSSRSGIVLFSQPVERVRVEEVGYTALRGAGLAASYEIRIRPGFETWGPAANDVEGYAQRLAAFYQVYPASAPATYRHPGGFDVAMRNFSLLLPDGRVTTLIVAVLKSGTKGAIIEFAAAGPQSPQAVQQMIGFLNSCALTHTQVLVSGKPALTVFDVEESTDLLQWLIDVRLTSAQRELIRSHFVDGWRRKDAEVMRDIKQALDFRGQLIKLPPAQQLLVREQNEAEMVAGLRAQTDDVSRMLSEIYSASHQPIAAGAPPLMRRQADAALDLFYFMAGQLEGVQASASPAAKDMWATQLAQTWPTLPSATRQAIASTAMTLAMVSASWPTMAPALREQLKAAYAQMDVVSRIRLDLVTARNQAAQIYASTQAPTPQSRETADVSAQIEKMNRNYDATKSFLTSSYNSTMTMMAGIGNWSGPRYSVR